MSYKAALVAAGADVMAFEEFGSYQGDWWAAVMYRGEMGFVRGSYGSCSGCDSFQAEFTSAYEDTPGYNERLAKFGESYLDVLYTQEQAIKEAGRNSEWDSEADLMVAFVSVPLEQRWLEYVSSGRK